MKPPIPRCLIVLLLFALPVEAADKPLQIPTLFRFYIGGALGPSESINLSGDTLIDVFYEGQRQTKRRKIKPSAAQWREFRLALDQINVWRWHADYPNHGTADGTQWATQISYPDHSLKAKGDNNFPMANGSPSGKPEHTIPFKNYERAIDNLMGRRYSEQAFQRKYPHRILHASMQISSS